MTSPTRATTVAVALALIGCASVPHAERAATEILPAYPTSGGYVGRFNNHDQSHADFCVRLRVPVAELRYPNGATSGFRITPDLLVPMPGNGVSCPERGLARLDARELVSGTDGRAMYFHRGGWGFAGDDPLSAVHFGHVLASDLDTVGVRYLRADPAAGRARGAWVAAPTQPWAGPGQLAGNGSPCESRSLTSLRISVQSMPADMRYLNSAATTAIAYAIYGDPSEDLGPPSDRARGVKYTMLTWSWINVRGGGVARALLPEGEQFFRCNDVPVIQLSSVADAQSRRITGWVAAAYGAIHAGDGTWLYGWTVYAHQRSGEGVVAHMLAN